MISNSFSTSLSVMAEVGSSMITIFALRLTAFAISTICISAMLRSPIRMVGSIFNPRRRKTSEAVLIIFFLSMTRGKCCRTGSEPTQKFSATLSLGIWLSSWWIMATPLAMLFCTESIFTF